MKIYTEEPKQAGNARKAWLYLTKNSPWGIRPKEVYYSPCCDGILKCWVADYGDATSYGTYGACTVPRFHHVSCKELRLYVNDDGTTNEAARAIADEEKTKAREAIKGRPYGEALMILREADERAVRRIEEGRV